ncbi:substrate-binding periplasmic protein, partial [Curvivirga aplysinae]|uniref:substrate-binding periplasmic protein n=1 Tax=Curvivirga aplysinae TaxID=2529852 RepID=UPI0012BCD594
MTYKSRRKNLRYINLDDNFLMLRKTLFFSCLIIIAFLASDADAKSRNLKVSEFVVMANPQIPHKFMQDNKPAGIDADIVKLFFESEKIPYRIELIESDNRLLLEAKQGRADMLLLFSRNLEREKFLIYPDISYIDITWNFFVRADRANEFRSGHLEDLIGFRVGATEGISYTDRFWSSNLTLDKVAKNSLQITKLLNGRIDTVPLNTINTRYEAQLGGYLHRLHILQPPLKFKSYYNVFSK